jgi:hypothetical protein
MAKYCDTKILEKNWFMWLACIDTPQLDQFREAGCILTKVTESVKVKTKSGSRTYPDALKPGRTHVIPTANPVYLWSKGPGISKPHVWGTNTWEEIPGLPVVGKIVVSDHISQILYSKGYELMPPTSQTWHAIFSDLWLLCNGIAKKFTLTPEAREDLASNVLAQVASKIMERKLTYTPGRAPVFSLLTTTIFRLMCTSLSKDVRRRKNDSNIAEIVASMSSNRSSSKRTASVRRFGSVVACSG